MDRETNAQNVAGCGARMMAKERRSVRKWLGYSSLVCLAYLFAANLLNLHARNPWVWVCCIAGLVVIGRGISPLMDLLYKRENHAVGGAEAEEAVGAILDRLPDNYMVLHDVPGPWGNIDHIVLRKDGAVFVIETKSMRGSVSERNGQLLLNAKPPGKDFIRQTLRNAMQVQNKLAVELGITPWVNAALVFTQAYVSVRGELGRVQVMNVRFLQEWIARAPGQAEVARRVAMKCEKVRSVLRSEQSPMQNEMELTAKNEGEKRKDAKEQRSKEFQPLMNGYVVCQPGLERFDFECRVILR